MNAESLICLLNCIIKENLYQQIPLLLWLFGSQCNENLFRDMRGLNGTDRGFNLMEALHRIGLIANKNTYQCKSTIPKNKKRNHKFDSIIKRNMLDCPKNTYLTTEQLPDLNSLRKLLDECYNNAKNSFSVYGTAIRTIQTSSRYVFFIL